MTMRGVDDICMVQADSAVKNSQRILLFGPQSKSSAGVGSIVRSLEPNWTPRSAGGERICPNSASIWHTYMRPNIQNGNLPKPGNIWYPIP